MSERHSAGSGQPDPHSFTTAEAAAAGEDDSWQNQQIVDPDDTQRDLDVFEDDEGE